jgi:hypothetical protein
MRADNPFELIKASDYSDRQIHEYWVDSSDANEGLVAIIRPRVVVPMLLLGGKGSGKTHLMRHCSAQVQELRHDGKLSRAVSAEGFLGIYARVDGLNIERFAGKGQPPETWDGVFAFAFELWLGITLLSCVRRLLASMEQPGDADVRITKDVKKLLHADIGGGDTLEALSNALLRVQRDLDRIVNNCALSRSLAGIEIVFNPGDFIFGIPEAVARNVSSLSDTTFTYLIDEVENFTLEQQKFLNDLIRYRRGNSTIRVGARLYGIKTRNTRGSGEPIKRDAEYQQVELDALLRSDFQTYDRLARRLILSRIRAAGIAKRNLGEEDLNSCFAEVSASNYFSEIALHIVEGRDAAGSPRVHLNRFRKAVRRLAGKQDVDRGDRIACTLALVESPILEKANLLAFYKRLSPKVDPEALASEIAAEARALMDRHAPKSGRYYESYSHFSSDLLAQLCRDYQQKPIYAGFGTLVRLSQGVPRNLLILLQNVYRESVFAGEKPFGDAQISLGAQIDGIEKASGWFWDDAQPDQFGPQVRAVVELLGTLFRTVRYADNPSECDLCSFRVDVERLSDSERKLLEMAQNWSFIFRTDSPAGAKNDNRIVPRFQLNPMLAPRWGVSESRRGSIELSDALASAVFGLSDNAVALIRDRTNEMMLDQLLARRMPRADSGGDIQTSMFDDDE